MSFSEKSVSSFSSRCTTSIRRGDPPLTGVLNGCHSEILSSSSSTIVEPLSHLWYFEHQFFSGWSCCLFFNRLLAAKSSSSGRLKNQTLRSSCCRCCCSFRCSSCCCCCCSRCFRWCCSCSDIFLEFAPTADCWIAVSCCPPATVLVGNLAPAVPAVVGRFGLPLCGIEQF